MKRLKSWVGWACFMLVAGYLVTSMHYGREVSSVKSVPPANKAGAKTNPMSLPSDTSAPAGVKVKHGGNSRMASRKLSSVEDFIEHIKSGKANASPQNYVQAMKIYHPEAGVKDTDGMYDYFQKNLDMVDCPQGVEYILGSVTPNGELGAFRRSFGIGERCFKDGNTEKIIASAQCGNVGASTSPPVVTPPKVAVAQLPQGEDLAQKVARACGGPAKFANGKWVCVKAEPSAPVATAKSDDFFASAVDEEEQEAPEPAPVRRQRAVYVAPPAPYCPAYIDSNGMLVPEGYRRAPGGGRVLCR